MPIEQLTITKSTIGDSVQLVKDVQRHLAVLGNENQTGIQPHEVEDALRAGVRFHVERAVDSNSVTKLTVEKPVEKEVLA